MNPASKRWRSSRKFVRRFLCIILALVCPLRDLIFPGSLPILCTRVLRWRYLFSWYVEGGQGKHQGFCILGRDHLWLEGKLGARSKEKVKEGERERWRRARVGARATRQTDALGLLRRTGGWVCVDVLKMKMAPNPPLQAHALEVHSERWVDFSRSFQLEPPSIPNARKTFSARQDSFPHIRTGQKSVVIPGYRPTVTTRNVPCSSSVQRPLGPRSGPSETQAGYFVESSWSQSGFFGIQVRQFRGLGYHSMQSCLHHSVPHCGMLRQCLLFANGIRAPDSSSSRKKRFYFFKGVRGTECTKYKFE